MLLSYEIESLRRPRKKTRRQQRADNIVCYIAVGFELPVRADRSSNDKKGECCCCDWKKKLFPLIQFLSCPGPSVDVGRFVGLKKQDQGAVSVTNSRRARTHATCACYCCCCCCVRLRRAVPGGPGSSFSWWLPGEVAPPTNKTGPGSIPLPIP